MLDIYVAITVAATVHFAQPDALKVDEAILILLLTAVLHTIPQQGSLGTTLKEVQPTMFFGVPRLVHFPFHCVVPRPSLLVNNCTFLCGSKVVMHGNRESLELMLYNCTHFPNFEIPPPYTSSIIILHNTIMYWYIKSYILHYHSDVSALIDYIIRCFMTRVLFLSECMRR